MRARGFYLQQGLQQILLQFMARRLIFPLAPDSCGVAPRKAEKWRGEQLPLGELLPHGV